MRICGGGDFSTTQEHLQQIITEGGKTQEALHPGSVTHAFVPAERQRASRRPTFHAAAVLLEGVASGALVFCLLAARRRHAALRRQRRVIGRGKVLPPHCVVWAHPVRAAGLGAAGDGGHGLLQPTELHLSAQTWHGRDKEINDKLNY